MVARLGIKFSRTKITVSGILKTMKEMLKATDEIANLKSRLFRFELFVFEVRAIYLAEFRIILIEIIDDVNMIMNGTTLPSIKNIVEIKVPKGSVEVSQIARVTPNRLM